MSAIAAVVSGSGASLAELAERMTSAMSTLGVDTERVLLDTPGNAMVAFAIGRHAWEGEVSPEGGSGLAVVDGVVVAADASLYHRADLVRTLRAAEVSLPGATAAHLIAAAYAVFGDDCVHRLEGDFAFVLWDVRRQRLLAARDFAGSRTLFHALHGGRFLVATTVGGLLADVGIPRDLDMASLATVAAGCWSHAAVTAYRAITELRSGHLLVRDREGRIEVREYWRAPTTTMRHRARLDDGAAELRALLTRATLERLAPSGRTSVSLSGGWDSTAVYAAAESGLRAAPADGRKRRMAPVSISYPMGDPGREDELIDAVVTHWHGSTRLISVDDIPMFHDAVRAAARRDLPMAHTYEEWNRSLSRGARAVGARVILDGVGGDQLFQVSDIFQADLFRRLQWIELVRQHRARHDGRLDLRALYRWAIRPVMPARLVALVARLRRMTVPAHYLERRPPFWFNEAFLRRHGVDERERSERPSLPRGDATLAEAHAFLRFPFYPRIVGMLHRFGVEEGVEVRSPLLDERVVRFAIGRPWAERSDDGETKVLLRHAMRGLLPDHVLAPRPQRTGVTSAYFLRQMRGPGRPLLEAMLADSRLAAIGMIDASRLRRGWEHLLAHDDAELGARLYFTLQAELWVRTRIAT